MYYFMRKYLHPDEGAGGTNTEGASTGKTFTQEDVNRMMAEEKRQGRASVLKELGFEDEASAKDTVSKYQKSLDDQKTDIQKAQEAAAAALKEKAETEAAAQLLQRKLDALTKGVSPEFLDDALAIAVGKITDKDDLGKVLDGMKERYPMFFTSNGGSGSSGTGTAPGNKKAGQAEKGIGTRLGEQVVQQQPTKSHYFG